ncbi:MULTISPECIES: sensor histidine kinase [unclassified Leeuwenhoekiella]|uniref:sensor histidine kinase n=1 Tax=unclassified Leeuwenhoekiella TaxID=2615029 RepID=UPI0025BED9B1|nr:MULTISPECIES: sensor histidine kinase [unclassified Leeuwenhoekiella]
MPCFFLLFAILTASGQQSNRDILDLYFQNLKELEFTAALSQAEQLENPVYKSTLQTFANLTYEGFTGDASDYRAILESTELSDPFLESIRLLNRGYYAFYFTSDRTAAYPYFYSALKQADQTAYKPLQRRVLLAILQYFHHEIARNNNNYDIFLNRYRDLIKDVHDEVLHKIYELIFLSSEIDIKSVYYKNASTLEEFIPRLEADCKLFPKLYLEIALYHELQDDYQKSEAYYQKVIDASGDLPYYRDSRFSAITKLAYLKHIQGNSVSALEKLEETSCCYNPQDSLKNRFFVEYYRSLFYEGMGKDSLALAHYKTYVDTGHKINFRDNSLEISRLQVELETEKKATDLILEKQKKKRFLLIAVTLGSLLIIALIIGSLVIQNSQKKRKLAEQQKDLERQKVSNLLKDQELASIDAMIEGQEKERSRIAGELHDDLGALMTNVRMHFEALENSPSEDLYQKTNILLDEAYTKVRSIAQAKNSGVIANQGLLKAIKDLAHKISQLNGLKINVQAHGMDTRLENSLELSLFRIIQELITNVIKHAQAKSLTIHLVNHGDSLNLMVEDDGVGFDPRHISKRSDGMGLNSIDKRVAHLNGTLEIESEPGKGTSVIIDLPL